MTNSKERVWNALNHRGGTPVPVDFGATTVTGIHCRIVEQLRKYYGLADKPVRIVDPFQMLGEVDEELQERMGVDLVPLFGQKNMFGIDESEVHEQVTPWGQKVLIAKGIDMTPDAKEMFIFIPKEIVRFLQVPLCPKVVISSMRSSGNSLLTKPCCLIRIIWKNMLC